MRLRTDIKGIDHSVVYERYVMLAHGAQDRGQYKVGTGRVDKFKEMPEL